MEHIPCTFCKGTGTLRLVYCPACGHSFSRFANFKVHLSADVDRERHMKLRAKYRLVKEVSDESPLHDNPKEETNNPH